MKNQLLKSLASKLGRHYIRKQREYCFKCPACRDDKYRLEVNLQIGFHCFHCGHGGGIPELLAMLELPYVRESITSNLKQRDKSIEEKEGGCPLPKGFVEPSSYRDAKNISILKTLLLSKGLDYPSAFAEYWGFTDENSKFRNRVIIPIKEGGKIVCWVARTLTGEIPKEICPSSKVSNRSHFVYGLDDIEEDDKLVIVEGIFDCEKMKSYGYKCVALMGSHISDIQVGKILSKRPGEIYIMLDGDETGREGARDVERKIKNRSNALSWRVIRVTLPEGKDPDELSKDEVYGLLKYEN